MSTTDSPTVNVGPRTFDEYIGQEQMKREVHVHLCACLKTGEPFPHTLLAANPGVGKSAIANLIGDALAEARDEEWDEFTKPVPVRELAAIADVHRGVVFFDEIHRWPRKEQEELLPLLESGYVEYRGRHPAAHLTVIAATTDPQKLAPALVDRFMLRPTFVDYSTTEMLLILTQMLNRMRVFPDLDSRMALAQACAGSPRRARAIAIATRALTLTLDIAPSTTEILDFARISADGLSDAEMRYLKVLFTLGSIAGLDKLAFILDTHPSAVEIMERGLFARGLITFGNQGRELTSAGQRRVRDERLHREES